MFHISEIQAFLQSNTYLDAVKAEAAQRHALALREQQRTAKLKQDRADAKQRQKKEETAAKQRRKAREAERAKSEKVQQAIQAEKQVERAQNRLACTFALEGAGISSDLCSKAVARMDDDLILSILSASDTSEILALAHGYVPKVGKWTQSELAALARATNKYPAGTKDRWTLIHSKVCPERELKDMMATLKKMPK